MNTSTIDWAKLEFTCVNEADLLPTPAPETDAWHKEARAYFKAAEKLNSDDLFRRSFELTRKAAEAGHVKAMNNLVVNYLDGDGTAPNEDKAVEWAEKLIKKNIGMGYYHMGVFLQQGIGVRQDRKAALAYFRKAADLGNAQGQLVLGDKIIGAVAQTPDRERGYAIAKKALECSLAQGNSDAGYRLGRFYENTMKNMTESLKYYQIAARFGHELSLFSLYQIFKEGKHDISKDASRTACYENFLNVVDEDKTKTFPDIDRICPLPPKPMPRSAG